MASVTKNAAEGSRSGFGKTYITCEKPKGYVKRQKKATGSRCEHRKVCGASYGVVPRKKRIKVKS